MNRKEKRKKAVHDEPATSGWLKNEFEFIVGYTSWGFPYGTRIEDLPEEGSEPEQAAEQDTDEELPF